VTKRNVSTPPFVYCWCPGCGMVCVEREPLPFCRHNIEATAPHPARRMEPLPDYHPFARDFEEMA
jgi:hypothetical protein